MTLSVLFAGFLSGWFFINQDRLRALFSSWLLGPSAPKTRVAGGLAASAPAPATKRKPDAITSSHEVDEQLRALIELICTEFVDNWYGQISTDVEFRETVKWILMTAARNIDDRAMKVKLPELIKDMVYLIIVHFEDFSAARLRHNSAFTSNLTMEQIFSNRQPHFALADARTEEVQYSFLALFSHSFLRNIFAKSPRGCCGASFLQTSARATSSACCCARSSRKRSSSRSSTNSQSPTL